MSIIQAFFLGVIQGIAEFLPVSSSGHLEVAQYFFKLKDVPLLFDVLLHVGTLAAVCVVFRKRIVELLAVLWRLVIRKPQEADSADRKTILALVIATAVTGVIGFAIKDIAKTFPLLYISCAFVVTGILLFFSSRYKSKNSVTVPGPLQALVIGFSQGIGVFPGISRSGITISASLFSGLERKAAGEFSFLLSIPAIVAAFMLELKDADILSGSVAFAPLAVGVLTAFAVGYFSLEFLLGLINNGKLGRFAWYLVPVGLALTVYFAVH